jgi:ubiquinone/menaquinone biosynthesis C-methylase UbiE
MESWAYDCFVAEAAVSATTHLRAARRDEQRLDAPIIDVGCGGGQLTLTLSTELPEAEIIGVDLSAEQVQRANRRAASNHRVHFQQASAEDLPFDDDSASAMISVASIKHWPNQHKRLAEMVRVLRPSGLLIVLELDRGCSLADAQDFMARCRYPRFLQ